MKCRHCGTELSIPFVDLGSAPPSNAYLGAEDLRRPEKWYPLRTLTCHNCWLVQTEDYSQADELFNAEYAYFSGYSSTWLTHCEHFIASAVARFGLGADSHVVEVAANDGYLLQYVKARGVPCLGIEPTASTADAARAKGIPIVQEFFGKHLALELANMGRQADLAVANNVLAHVPDINDFVAGFAILLKPQGVASFEFPHLMHLVAGGQFDTIYHEHFSYLSFGTVMRIFEAYGLDVFDVEELPTHGGSLRVYAQRSDTGSRMRTSRVGDLVKREVDSGMFGVEYYAAIQLRIDRIKDDLLRFLLQAKLQGQRVAAYGAAAKGNTLLNYAGVRPDLLPYVVDRNPNKVGKFLPGSRIPIVDEAHLRHGKPDYVLLLPWNLREELVGQLEYIRTWAGKFVTAVPSLIVS